MPDRDDVHGLNAGHDADAAMYEALRTSWLNRRRADFVSAALRSLVPGSSVLEIGSGTGALLNALAQRRPDLRFTGVEPLPNYCEWATQRASERGLHVAFHVGFAEDLPNVCGGARFDYVLSNDTLHHVADEAATALSVAQVCRPRAQWLAIEPSNLNPLMAAYHYRTPGERNFHSRRFRRLAAQAGWRQESRRFLFAIPHSLTDPPAFLKAIERGVERVPGVAGGVALRLVLDT